MEEAALAVQIKRAEKAKEMAKQQEERLKRAAAAEAAQRKEGLRIIYADFANAMRQGNFEKIVRTVLEERGLHLSNGTLPEAGQSRRGYLRCGLQGQR